MSSPAWARAVPNGRAVRFDMTNPETKDASPSAVVLTGFMGSGKTVVGRRLAQLLGFEFADTDEIIESRHGPIPAMFAASGEAQFRKHERDTALELADCRRMVVATGGGLMLDPVARSALTRSGWVFCLRASPETVVQRVKTSPTTRPLIGTDDPLTLISSLMEERRVVYERFLTISTDGKNVDEVAEEIAAMLPQRPIQRAAARLLLIESHAVRPIVDQLSTEEQQRPTICTGWSVGDVVAHCSAALTRVAAGDLRGFSPEENQRDVDQRRRWDWADLCSELFNGYSEAAAAIDEADGRLDGVGLGEWMHGGDLRLALDHADAYRSPGVDLALDLLVARSVQQAAPLISVELTDGTAFRFGDERAADAVLRSDLASFVRLCGGRANHPGNYDLKGADPEDMVLFR